jgi:transcriptional regulator with XRE-family HTH domain
MLRAFREREGMTREQLAARARVTTAYVSLLESGKRRNPSLAILKRLATALAVSVTDLMSEGGIMQTRVLQEAHLPTFFKIQLRGAARGGDKSYAEVGWHLGKYHLGTFDLDEDTVLNVSTEEIERKATATLRHLFASERHPEAGLVDYIPARRRRAFLRGLVYGAAGHEFGELEEE